MGHPCEKTVKMTSDFSGGLENKKKGAVVRRNQVPLVFGTFKYQKFHEKPWLKLK